VAPAVVDGCCALFELQRGPLRLTKQDEGSLHKHIATVTEERSSQFAIEDEQLGSGRLYTIMKPAGFAYSNIEGAHADKHELTFRAILPSRAAT